MVNGGCALRYMTPALFRIFRGPQQVFRRRRPISQTAPRTSGPDPESGPMRGWADRRRWILGVLGVAIVLAGATLIWDDARRIEYPAQIDEAGYLRSPKTTGSGSSPEESAARSTPLSTRPRTRR